MRTSVGSLAEALAEDLAGQGLAHLAPGTAIVRPHATPLPAQGRPGRGPGRGLGREPDSAGEGLAGLPPANPLPGAGEAWQGA